MEFKLQAVPFLSGLIYRSVNSNESDKLKQFLPSAADPDTDYTDPDPKLDTDRTRVRPFRKPQPGSDSQDKPELNPTLEKSNRT